MSEVPSPVEQLTSFNLLGLDNDCILAILRELLLDDLGAIACCCRRLRDVARQVFVLNEANQYYHIKYLTTLDADLNTTEEELISVVDDVRYPYRYAYNEMKRMRQQQLYSAELHALQRLVSFGDLIKEIDFDYIFQLQLDQHTFQRYANQKLLLHVFRYCAGTLQRLTVRDVDWTPQLMQLAFPLIVRLTKFNSSDCTNTELVFPALARCTDIAIINEMCVICFTYNFPKLQRFTFCCPTLQGEVVHYSRKMMNFLHRHKKIRHLKVDVQTKFDVTAIVLMYQLEELHINAKSIKLCLKEPTLYRACRLKKLNLCASRIEISPLLCYLADSTAVDTLEYLRVDGGYLQEDAVEALGRFNKLERFKFKNLSLKYPLIHCLPNLEHMKRLTLTVNHTRKYQLSTTPALDVLHISDAMVDDAFIDALIRMPQLKCLKLDAITMKSYVLLAVMPILIDVTGLEKLYMESNSAIILSVWLTYLGSTVTLRSLRIAKSEISKDVLLGICRYRNLEHIELSDCELICYEEESAMLCHLQGIKKLFLHKIGDCLSTFLRALQPNAMQTLHLNECQMNVHTIKSICRFRNLQELQIANANNLVIQQLWKLKKLDQLQMLTLVYTDTRQACFVAEALVDLVLRLKSVTCLVLKQYKIIRFTQQCFDGLLQARREQNRKIVIELHNSISMELPQFLFENDNCRYVEFRQTTLVEEEKCQG